MPVSFPILVLLTLASFGTALVSGMLGMAGGVLMLAVLVMLVETSFVVPLHAAIQVVSGGTRVVFFFGQIRWKVVVYYLIGVLPGTVLGILIFDLLPKDLLKLLMALFILAVLFVPQSKPAKSLSMAVFLPLGLVTGVLGVLFGATGPFLAPFFLRRDIVKEELVATKATCHLVSHAIKIPFFGFIGINVFTAWPLLLVLSLAVILGVYAGKRILSRINEEHFTRAFKIVLVLLALQILFSQLLHIL